MLIVQWQTVQCLTSSFTSLKSFPALHQSDNLKENIMSIETTINRNLLKYAVGSAIFCPSCGEIMDFRRAILWESPSGRTGVNCLPCWNKGLAKVHDDNPQDYLISIGWKLISEKQKTPKAKREAKKCTL